MIVKLLLLIFCQVVGLFFFSGAWIEIEKKNEDGAASALYIALLCLTATVIVGAFM